MALEYRRRLLRASGDRPSRRSPSGDLIQAPPRERRSTPECSRVVASGGGSSARAEIDPDVACRGVGQDRLLRASGDRPAWVRSAGLTPPAPPRERRSTLLGGQILRPHPGSSARAEIDPRWRRRSSCSTRLLRASGDRPGSAMTTTSTGGSSARAEIDPWRRCPRAPSPRLLRASGDRPSWWTEAGFRTRAPPRERRSTLGVELAQLVGEGSSARAEIDPARPSTSRGSARLLRASGDRPRSRAMRCASFSAPPRERRSTPDLLHILAFLEGSSARAEIDPSRCGRWRGCGRLLRASGDRPEFQRLNQSIPEAPPRERRSTLVAHGERRRGLGSSARAEIDPSAPSPTPSWRRLLRASGDRPSISLRRRRSFTAPPRERRSTRRGDGDPDPPGGSSARAEIDPSAMETYAVLQGLLRASGDRPHSSKRIRLGFEAPPRERRSTRHRGVGALPRRGSSARAEIDPRLSKRMSSCIGLLRASGDRPRSSSVRSSDSRAPPRERRSTRDPDDGGRSGGGSSARAEIDP